MSRTYKDKPWKKRFRDWHDGYEDTPYIAVRKSYYDYYLKERIYEEKEIETSFSLKVPGFWPKLKREVDENWHWCSATPSWWTRMWMNRPERHAAHLQETLALKVIDLEEVDFPDLGRKPHQYYW